MDDPNILQHVVLLVNLGSPDKLNTLSIRLFLRNFLTDNRVVQLPKILWYPILYGCILPFRAKKLLKQYNQIWLKDNSPLVYYTQLQAQKLALKCKEIKVLYAFSYSSPQLNNVLAQLDNKVAKLTVVPLYPQFSSTTTMAVFDEINRYYKNKYSLPEIHFITGFAQNALYIKALTNSINKSWQINGRSDKLIFSYHGIPEEIVSRGDTYFDQCKITSQLIAKQMGLRENEYIIAFQSKFGRQKWLLPSTAATLIDLARDGIKSVDIICPGFVSDCLETLEEIAIINKAAYINAGGQVFNYIPCLNDHEDFIQALSSLI